MSTSYATTDQLIARLPSLSSHDWSELENALEASSRWIDAYCARRFWLDTAVTDRVFIACNWYVIDLGQFEIGDLTGVVVKTDDGSGTFATTVSSSAYQLEPVNAPYSASAAAPYTQIRAVSTTWPMSYVPGARQALVQITAKYGWPSVPAAVREACLSLTVDRFENPSNVRAEAIDGYSVSWQSTEAVKPSLSAFRRMWVA